MALHNCDARGGRKAAGLAPDFVSLNPGYACCAAAFIIEAQRKISWTMVQLLKAKAAAKRKRAA